MPESWSPQDAIKAKGLVGKIVAENVAFGFIAASGK